MFFCSFLLEDSHKNRHSQLERIIFSENFLKEENGSDLRADPTGVASTGGSEAQLRHRKHVQVLIRSVIQSGPSGRRTLFVDIKLKVLPQYKSLIQGVPSELRPGLG